MLKGITYCTLLQQQCQRFQKSDSSPQLSVLFRLETHLITEIWGT